MTRGTQVKRIDPEQAPQRWCLFDYVIVHDENEYWSKKLLNVPFGRSPDDVAKEYLGTIWGTEAVRREEGFVSNVWKDVAVVVKGWREIPEKDAKILWRYGI